jgi:REP element-mobilizing transposase RayT
MNKKNSSPNSKTKSAHPRQFILPGIRNLKAVRIHGGDHSIGKRKSKRPFDPKQALHVVLRSSKAHGKLSMLSSKRAAAIQAFLNKTSRRWNVRIYRYANVGNHLHLLVRSKSRAEWQGFIRDFSGNVAILITGAKKGLSFGMDLSVRKFWDQLVFTRIVKFGKDFVRAGSYLLKNWIQGREVMLNGANLELIGFSPG